MPNATSGGREANEQNAVCVSIPDSSAGTAVCVFSPDGVLIQANQCAFDAAGMTPQTALGKRYNELHALSHRADVAEHVRTMFESAARGEVVRSELPVRLAADRIAIMDCMASPLRDVRGDIVSIVGTAVEITARRESEAEMRRLYRALRMLTNCTQILARVTVESDLLSSICKTVVDGGGYPLAWIGLEQQSADRAANALAWAGEDASYIQRHGYSSSVALPIETGSERLILNIYSERVSAFDATELELLRELTADLEHGIRSLRAVAAHKQAEDRLTLFRKLLEEANDLIYLVDLETGLILDANAAMARHLGYTRDDLLQMKLVDVSVTASDASWAERVDFARTTGAFMVEGQHRRKDGEIVPVEISCAYVEHGGRPYLITVTRDISERKRQQAQIARLARVSRLQAAMNAAVLRIRDRDELLAEACRLATSVGGYDRAVVSIVDADGRRARPRYRAGHAGDFPEPAVLAIGDGSEPDVCLTGRALRTGEIAICTDLTKSEPPVAMRERLVELGYRSVVALPLVVDGHRLGALTLASRDTDLLWDEELPLLQDVTATLSFALRAQRQADEVQLLAFYDPLTGLANRALLCKRLAESIASIDGPARYPAVATFDVQHLTSINDAYGRRFGDLLLQQVATRLKQDTDDDQRIGYLGGGVFVLVEPELIGSEENIVSLLESTVFAEPFVIEGHSLRVTFRSGLARYPKDGTDSDALVQKAEAALRHAKDTGEQYLHYAVDLHSQIGERLALEGRLQSAIDEHQFELYYQPQIGVRSGRIESVEALLRWNDPQRGLVAPAAFLPVLEATSMIVPVGNWVLQRALSDCRRWAEQGLGPIRVAVNVSALQIRRRAFVPLVLDLLRLGLAGRAGYGLDLEITETALLQDIEGASRKLQELRDAGVRIALDDFGTGYSSLGLLSKLPVDLLKIDRSFVAGLPGDDASAALVRSIVELASAFRLVTVAEGVETVDQMAMLREMNCHQTQGYLHCPPIPAAQFEQLLRNPNGILAREPGPRA